MHPLSFAEFMSEYEGNKYDGWNEYVLYGGLPPVVLLSTLEQKIAFLKNLFKETYINDIIHKQLEVDFVCNKGSKRYYVQFAFAIPDNDKMKQESNSLLHIDDSFRKIIVVKDTLAPSYTEDGILVIGIYDFLLKSDSLDL